MFKIINIYCIKNAKKNYNYYNGKIKIGDSYYRGFALFNGIPFEFLFTDKNVYKGMKFPSKILSEEYIIHKIKKNRYY